MKTTNYIKILAIALSLLITSLPIVFAGELNLQYDANGNLVTGDGKFREYNSLNQLVRVRNGSLVTSPLQEDFVYHPIEERIYIKRAYHSNGTIAETVYYLSKTFVQVQNASGMFNFTYVYQDGVLVAQVNPDGKKLFIHSDHLGSSTVEKQTICN